MKLRLITLLVVLALVPLTAHAWDRGPVERFATLPQGEHHPEGITVDDAGNVYGGYTNTLNFRRWAKKEASR